MIDDIKGMGFPFGVDEATGGIAWARGAEKIRQNVRIILGTRYGERPMLREFGTKLASLVHDPNDDVLADLLKNQVQENLLRFEPRILVTDVQVEQDPDEGEVQLRLQYTFTTEPGGNVMLIPLR
jgi:phage baseplate assembly protein W